MEVTGAAGAEDSGEGAPGINMQHAATGAPRCALMRLTHMNGGVWQQRLGRRVPPRTSTPLPGWWPPDLGWPLICNWNVPTLWLALLQAPRR